MKRSLDESNEENTFIYPDPEIEDLVPTFIENRFRELPEMKQAAVGRDFATLKRFAHTWKGICRPYGFVYLEKLSRALEEAADGADGESVDELMALIEHHLQRVKLAPSQ